jgi:DNA-binding transcriptional LysR family regulator
MELRHLEYFMAVCEELHFSRAADKLGISQPNLSLQIKTLEEEIGTPLFDRMGKRIALNRPGEVLLKHCRTMFTHLHNARVEIGELCSKPVGELAVGVLPSELDFRLAPLFADFHHRFPQVRLRLCSTADILKKVLDTSMDIGISQVPLPDDRLTVIPLATEEYGLVVSEGHELAGCDSISLAQLRGLPMVMYPRGYWGRDLVESCCGECGFELNAVIETTSNPALFHFVGENIGATVQTGQLVRSVGDPRLRFIRIGDRPPVRNMGILHRSDKYMGHAARTLLGKLKEHLEQR